MRFGLIMATLFLIGGCASSPLVQPPANNNESLIFGYVDMRESRARLSGAVFKQISPPIEWPFHISNIHRFTVFYTQHGVQPGIYKMDNLRTIGGFQDSIVGVYDFPKSGKGEMDLKITKPGVYFVGSWKFKRLDGDKFDIERLNSPTELEVISQVLPYAEDKYWKDMILARIEQLKKSK